jgi:predicted DNA-binding transcriptional regulator YafY
MMLPLATAKKWQYVFNEYFLMRSSRLLQLLQILRRHRLPVSGQKLANELDASIRTLYCDIATLQMQGAEIEGEAGVGYIFKPGFFCLL